MTTDVIDKNGYRKNVCIVITNAKGKVLLARRISDKGWQFPQGGVLTGETYREAMYRELYEEVGLSQDDIEITTATSRLYFYRLPEAFVNHHRKPICIGQKQKWYLLKLRVSPNKINLNIYITFLKKSSTHILLKNPISFKLNSKINNYKNV